MDERQQLASCCLTAIHGARPHEAIINDSRKSLLSKELQPFRSAAFQTSGGHTVPR